MAKFINTKKTVSEIEDLIRNAGEKLILVSPFLKLSKDFKELLSYRNGKERMTTIIFGKQELSPDELKFLQSLQLVVLKYHEDLHAKCYTDGEKMIITSMNLYEFSMVNNKEMGVLIDGSEDSDKKMFEDAMKEVVYISEMSQRFELVSTKPSSSSKPAEKVNRNNSFNHKAYCIRTGVPIPFDIERPLSYDAYLIWNQYGDPFYPEKYCHFSGELSHGETSVNKPVLNKNWKKAKEMFGF